MFNIEFQTGSTIADLNQESGSQSSLLIMLITLLTISLTISGCSTTSSRASKKSTTVASEQLTKVVDNTANAEISSGFEDGNYYIGMPDSALGSLSSLEKEMAEFEDFKVLTYSGGISSKSAPARFDEAYKKQQYNSSVKIFEEDEGFEGPAIPEMLAYVEALYNTGAHGKSLSGLQTLQEKLESDFNLNKNGDYDKSFFDLYEDSFILSYSRMLSGYSRYYETLGDYRRAIHFAEKAHRIKAALADYYLPGKFDIGYAITMARLSAITGDKLQTDSYIADIENFVSPTIWGITILDGDILKRMQLDGKIGAYLAAKDYSSADALVAERNSTSEEDAKTSGAMWGFALLATLLDPIQGVMNLTQNAVTDSALTDIYESDSYKQGKAIREAFIPSKVAFEMGRYDIARKGYDAILANRVASEQTVIYYTILHDLGKIALTEGDSDSAKNYLVQAIDILESQRSSFNSEASKIGFIGDKQAIYFSLIKLLIDRDQLDEALRYVERSKARALVDMLAQKDLSVSGKAKTEYRQQLSAYSAIQQSTEQSDFTITPQQRALKLKKSKNLTRELQQAAPDLASLVSVDVPSIGELQTQLNKDEVLIEYYGDADELYAFVLTSNSIHAKKLDGTSLADTVKTFRQALLSPADKSFQLTGKQLYRQLIQPLKPYLKTQKLAIVPHGALHYLPFAALIPKTDNYVLDDYQIRILPSASVMRFLNSRTKNKRYMLALGNPDLERDDLNLPGAQTEVESIGATQPNIESFFRKGASETLIKQSSSQYQRLHIASHGVFYPDNPMQSSLLLAKDESNDGNLTVSEIYDLDLNADLVTLSACETGLGKITNGDDVIGLNRGFLYAGANTIISSLWQVSDSATADLMTLFYQNSGSDKREALHSAQLSVKQKYPHPYYWAAFQLTGAVN